MIKLAHPDIPEEAIARAADVLRSGQLVQGIHVRALEEKLEAYLAIPHAVVVSSGTAALHLALLALDIGPGDEVVVPAFTFPATANAVELVGARPVLADISLDDFCLDPSSTEDAVSADTRLILPVHEFGQAADMEALGAVAARRSLDFLEDAACALGATCKGRNVGTVGRIGCFSFHPRKILTTGEGGAAVTADAGLAEKMRAIRNHGLAWRAGIPAYALAGLNYRMTEFQAALGLAQWASLPERIAKRQADARRYEEALADIPWIRPPAFLSGRPSTFQTYHVLLAEGVDRDRIIQKLGEAGIETNLGAQALPRLPFYQRKYGWREQACPRAMAAFRQGLALPMGGHVTPEDIARIGDTLRTMQ